MESKRDQFRTYLAQHNVNETLNRAMIALNNCEEPPKDVLNFFRSEIGAEPCENVDQLIRENQYLQARVAQLRQELATYSK